MAVKNNQRFNLWCFITIALVLGGQCVSASHLLAHPNPTINAKKHYSTPLSPITSYQQTNHFISNTHPFSFYFLPDLVKAIEQAQEAKTKEKAQVSATKPSSKTPRRLALTMASAKKPNVSTEQPKAKRLKIVDGKPYLDKQEITWEQYNNILGVKGDWSAMDTETKFADQPTPENKDMVAGSGIMQPGATQQKEANPKPVASIKEQENNTIQEEAVVKTEIQVTAPLSYKDELRQERANYLAQEVAKTETTTSSEPNVEVMIVDGQYYVNGQKVSYAEFEEACKLPSSPTPKPAPSPQQVEVSTPMLAQEPVATNDYPSPLASPPTTIPLAIAETETETANTTAVEDTTREIATRGVYVNYMDYRNMPDTLLLSNVYNESIPSHQHYDFNWNNHRVHPYKYDLTQMPRVVTFLLTHGFDEDFCMPTIGYITSEFGPRWKRYHNGIDIDLETGDPVKAAFKGKVRIAQTSSGYGYLIVLRHYNGLETYYAHLDKILVEEGQDVKAGEVIGLGGNTGRSTGSHLHFEVRYKGHPLNAREFIDFRRNRLKHHVYHLDKSYFTSSSPYKSSHDLYGNTEKIAVKTNYTPKSKSAARSGASKSSGKSGFHRIRSGDTLGKIARRYGTSIRRLCQLNKISTRTILRVGRKLKVR